MFWLPGHLHAGIFPPVETDSLCGACSASLGLLDRDTHPGVPSLPRAEGEVTASREGSEKALWERVIAKLCSTLLADSLSSLILIRYDVNQEVEIIQSNLAQLRREAHRRSGVWQRFITQPEIYKPFFIIIMLSVIQQFSGISILR